MREIGDCRLQITDWLSAEGICNLQSAIRNALAQVSGARCPCSGVLSLSKGATQATASFDKLKMLKLVCPSSRNQDTAIRNCGL